MLEVATAFSGELMNIDAFDQPGEKKVKMQHMLFLDDLDTKIRKLRLNNRPTKKERYIIK